MSLGAFVLESSEFEEHQDLLREAGIDRLVFPFDTARRILERARQRFRVFLEFKPFAGGKVENVYSQRKSLDALGCPSDRELRDRNLAKLVGKLAEVEVDGVILDFIRFPSPADGNFFYSCFCQACKRAATSLGYDLESIREKVKEFARRKQVGQSELLSQWFDFKKKVISDDVKEFVEAIGEVRKGAFLFSPSIASLAGQDYRELSSLLDVLHPMIYPEGGLGPACLGFEIHAWLANLKAESASDALREMYAFLGVQSSDNPRELETLKVKGLPDEIIEKETRKALQMSPKAAVEPIITVVDIPPDGALRRLEFAIQGGAKGGYLFAFTAEYVDNFAALAALKLEA